MTTTTTTTTATVATAASYLGGIWTSHTWYVYRDAATAARYRACRSELADLGRALLADEPDAYSAWCARTEARPVR